MRTITTAETTPVSWVFASRLFRYGSPRGACAHRKSLEEASQQVRRADANKLLIGVHFKTLAGGKPGGSRDGITDRHQRDAERCHRQDGDIRERDTRKMGQRETLRKRPNSRHIVSGQVEDHRHEDSGSHSDQDAWRLWGPMPQTKDDSQREETNRECPGIGLPKLRHDCADLLDEVVGLDRKAEQLRQLANENRDR